MNPNTLKRLNYEFIKQHLLEYAISYLGKERVESMMPMTGKEEIRSRLDETEQAKKLLERGRGAPIPSLEGIRDIMDLLGSGYIFSERNFCDIAQFLYSCTQLIRYMRSHAQAAPLVNMYTAEMNDLPALQAEIERCIRSGAILDTASKELLKIRKKKATAEERLKSKLASLANRYRSVMQENLISMRGGHYVLPIKKEHRKLVKGSVLDESASGQTVYMEPHEIVELQSQLSSLRREEADEEMKILSGLTAMVEENRDAFRKNVEQVGIYDFLFAKAKYGLEIGGTNVKLSGEGKIDLRDARHPLLGNRMVPLHFAIGEAYNSLIITGPNTGGKTLTLKTVGLLTLMAQSGLLVPAAEGSTLAVFTQIAVDIGDGQSLENNLSTFSAHIRNMMEILERADRSTLVLIDEMATGTDPGEGVALSVAILEELQRRGATVTVTTHFNEIKNFAEAADGFENARMEFDPATLQPLYRLRIGEAGRSYAFLIAQKLGMPAGIIERSREIASEGTGRLADHGKTE
ncbi:MULTISPECIES: DNA mismatch repair protein MutS [unclassified Paenibacillus]|uniref:endonuclease MutS2 n=1 Tax=Paenibacillus sp. HGF7 TaxID=944559 RepID=UPI00020D7ED0|nr:MutS domain V protein [Paenibacillus sp. HGF7]EPD89738.1 MutS2 family protein [Paenibacillus sp. HGH0039]